MITVTNWCGEKRAAALGGLVNHRTRQTMTRPALQLMTKRVLASILLWLERICWRSWHDQTCQIHQNAILPARCVDCMYIVLLNVLKRTGKNYEKYKKLLFMSDEAISGG
mgnify:CR=1 FL=1